MSWESGWKAINLEFSEKVPRTEYSVENYHWPLIQKVTGIDTSRRENRERAKKEFVRRWDYAFLWMTPTPTGEIIRRSGYFTSMGHAKYSLEGEDFNSSRFPPFKTEEEVYEFDPPEVFEEIPQKKLVGELNELYQKERKYWEKITLTMGGVYHTLFSGLIEIFGWEMLLLALGKDPKRFGKVIRGYYEWVKQFFEAWAKTDAEVFMCHDDICWSEGPVAHPHWYQKYIFPYYKRLWDPLLSAGKKIIFTSDGKYDEFFSDIVKCGATMLVMEPGNDMESFAKKWGKVCGFVGNADCRILLTGSREDIYKEVKRCMDIGKKYPGFIMAVGNHIPPNTPIDNALWYKEKGREIDRGGKKVIIQPPKDLPYHWSFRKNETQDADRENFLLSFGERG